MDFSWWSVRRRAATALACGAVGIVACGGDNGLTSPADTENVTRVFSVYAINGSSSALPAAYKFSTESVVRPQALTTGSVNFDLAFDIGAGGAVVLLPARSVVPQPVQPAPTIGLQKFAAGYLALQRAPDRGYTFDSTATLSVGEAVAIQIPASACFYGEPWYAKLAIDSVIPAERRIVVRTLLNRNCGYRALTEGVPGN